MYRTLRRSLFIGAIVAGAFPASQAFAAAPTANNDSRSVIVNSTVTINVLANDSDADGDTLTVTSVASPSHGQVTLNEDNSIRYVPDANYVGADSFAYTMSDTNQESSTATVIITVTDVTLESFGEGDNAESIGAAIDDLCPRLRAAATDTLSAGSQQLLARCESLQERARLDPAGVNEVLRWIAPEEITAQIRQASEFFRAQTLAVSQRQTYLASGHHAFTVNGLALANAAHGDGPLRGGTAGDSNTPGSRLNFFATALSGDSERDRTELEAGFDSTSQGLTLGADYRLRNDLFVGAAASWSDSSLDFTMQDGSIDAEITSLIGYTVWNSGNWSVDGQLGYATLNFDTQRSIAYANATDTVNTQASGNTSGDQWNLSAQLQYEMNWGALSVRPFGRADYVTTTIDAFGENNAAGWEVELEEQSQDQTVLALGVASSMAQNQSWGVLVPQAQLSAHNEVSHSHDTVYGHFAFDPDPSNRFAIDADENDTLYFLANIGVVAILPHGWSTYAQYQHLFGYADTSATQLSAGVRYEY